MSDGSHISFLAGFQNVDRRPKKIANEQKTNVARAL